MDDFIRDTLNAEAARNEKILAWLRCGLAPSLIPDFFGRTVTTTAFWTDIVCLAYLAAALLATYRWADRPWFKYVIMTADAAMILNLTVIDSANYISEGNFLGVGLYVCFLVVTASIRMSRWAVAYATGLAVVDLLIAARLFSISFPIAFGIVLLAWLLGCLSYFVMMRLSTLMADVTRKERLSRFLPPELVEHAARDPALLQLGGKRQSVTILFADIRGFTPMAESHPPEEVIGFLNDYFRVTTDVIFRHRGTLDKFMGDALMALFGAPLAHADDADRAVQAAVEIMEGVAEFNRKRASNGFCPIEIGIGINTADVIAGNIGSDRRMEYTVIGDGVNLAARLEKLTKRYETKIIISESTHGGLADKRDAVALGEVTVEGRSGPIRIYGVPHERMS